MNKAAYHVTYDDNLRKDANVLVDGRKSHNDAQCVSTTRVQEILIDLGDILSIHHIITYFEKIDVWAVLRMYIPIFISVLYFCLVLFFCMLQ